MLGTPTDRPSTVWRGPSPEAPLARRGLAAIHIDPRLPAADDATGTFKHGVTVWTSQYDDTATGGAYGAGPTQRVPSPDFINVLERLAAADGAVDVTTPNSSGYDELAMVYKNGTKDNSKPKHSGHPSNHTCEGDPATVG